MKADYCPVGGEPCQSLCDTPCTTKTEVQQLREALRVLLDRNLTYSGSDVIIPFTSHGIAVKQIAEARRLLRPNAKVTGAAPTKG